MLNLRLLRRAAIRLLLLSCLLPVPTRLLAAPIPVALLSYDEPSQVADVQSKLLATGAFSTVDLLGGTATLAELQAYPAVLAWDFDNQSAFGDILADYVDSGGGVVLMTFSLRTINVAGRFATDNYFAILPNMIETQGGSLGMDEPFTPSHPILAGVTSFSGGSSSYRIQTTDVHPSAVRVADWSNGTALIASRTIGGTHRADLNFYPVSSAVRGDFWDPTTDGALLMKNALVWVAGPLSSCGDGEIEAGEDCDDGGAIGCCDANCQTKSAGESCRDDGNVCTDEACDSNAVCLHLNNSAPCDDGTFCNGMDTCSAGSCAVHPGNPCTGGTQCNDFCIEDDDTCFPPLGSSCSLGGGIACSEPDFCDGSGTCSAGGGGDPDADSICSVDDNCAGVFNPSQKDINQDGEGDVCAASDAALNVTRVQIKSNKSIDKPNGAIAVKGSFLTTPAPPSNDVFDALHGLTLRVQDGLTLDLNSAPSFAPAECLPPSSKGVIKCKSADKRLAGKFAPTAPGGPVYTFTIKYKKLDTPASLFGPVTVTITDGAGVDRSGVISPCAPSPGKLFCRLL